MSHRSRINRQRETMPTKVFAAVLLRASNAAWPMYLLFPCNFGKYLGIWPKLQRYLQPRMRRVRNLDKPLSGPSPREIRSAGSREIQEIMAPSIAVESLSRKGGGRELTSSGSRRSRRSCEKNRRTIVARGYRSPRSTGCY